MKVALVEFLNAVPLYYALKKKIVDNDFEFISAVPSKCARLLFAKKVDISNASIVEYVNSEDYLLLPDGCISTTSRVKSVVLFLKKPLKQVKVVKLDKNSKTSVALTKVLFHFKYNMSVDYVWDGEADCELVIGDNALKRLKTSNGTVVDLAREWFEMTGLPFVFAAWITNRKLSSDTVEKFVRAKEKGKQLINDICEESRSLVGYDECKKYLTENIQYDLTKEKLKAIEEFLKLAYSCKAISNIRPLLFS
ncbi:menaquinone biosynthetic enzyme MqnA/MqnD family protein [Hippea alviniae]|uniref:menaquinone biosynthetic enzyme MqnA/MqnD family protein n=1 Tax=Hippea alviniae TaxID=1279027 RepID=UPI0003B6E78B|nr:menaquinone biosynthesis protein [Hippea alviniae]